MDYESLTIAELKNLCREREINVKLNKDFYIERLREHDGIPSGQKIDLEAPNPDNLNYDMAGRWRPRPRRFIKWDKDGEPIVAHGYNIKKQPLDANGEVIE